MLQTSSKELPSAAAAGGTELEANGVIGWLKDEETESAIDYSVLALCLCRIIDKKIRGMER